jgi:hypothetical protein
MWRDTLPRERLMLSDSIWMHTSEWVDLYKLMNSFDELNDKYCDCKVWEAPCNVYECWTEDIFSELN